MSVVFLAVLRQRNIPEPMLEFPFARPRRWRFDYCWPDHKLAVEAQGGLWIRGKHSRAAGILRDYEKLNTAQLMGWIVLQFTPDQLLTNEALDLIERVLKQRSAA